MKAKKINCKWCGMGHAPRSDGNHWIVKSISPAKIDIKECAYHKAGTASPIQHTTPFAEREPPLAEPRRGGGAIAGSMDYRTESK